MNQSQQTFNNLPVYADNATNTLINLTEVGTAGASLLSLTCALAPIPQTKLNQIHGNLSSQVEKIVNSTNDKFNQIVDVGKIKADIVKYTDVS